MDLPSGDQAGWMFCAPSAVSCISLPWPTSERMQISKRPLRSELYASESPPGEKLGDMSRPADVVSCRLLDETTWSGHAAVARGERVMDRASAPRTNTATPAIT